MDEDVITARLSEQIRRDYPEVEEEVADALRSLAVDIVYSRQDSERLLGAAVFMAAGDVDRLVEALQLGRIDWRDLLVAGGARPRGLAAGHG